MTSKERTGAIAVTKLTKETHERLVAELEDLTTRGRNEIATTIEAARALGDLSENGDYHAAKDTQGKMESRVRLLQALLKNAVVVEEHQGDGSVATGAVVVLRYDGDDEEDVQRFFVGSIEERRGDMPVVSPSAPLGKALLGRRSGDTVQYDAPGGSLKVTIVEVEA